MKQSKVNPILHPEKDVSYVKWKVHAGRVLSLIALILLSPLLILISAAIKLSDWHAPVIFKQQRVGKKGGKFYMYKFRTMRLGAEAELEKYLKQNEIEGAMFKMKKDPRVTRIGALLRKTSLDELPQLYNVLKGEMSLVGPRPPLPREVAIYTPYDQQRLLVTPGCTGLWQVSGRNELSFNQMVELDLHYIEQLSLKLDFKILCKTVIILLFPKGAY
ncbi:sugar transferase [Listeria grandensis]|uniref:sugar transferase n=1 Tax=Listeria grandensis TaxID=1494963 RepID=UPI00162A3F55|nr:sugar transferase [Listeria grandensis]MBC1475738.1 sugar transferase [Listeria grandensis]